MLTHTARMPQDCPRHITTLPWPTRSPDLSPVKHIWDILKQQVGQLTSLVELEPRLQQLWNECVSECWGFWHRSQIGPNCAKHSFKH
ncbi:transposable element Tcb2 transposase [Trichonephila clavipes]|nr:transposable element Tcb2 transposase [Trichonephila clavipes]